MMNKNLKLVRNIVLAVTPILFLYDRHLPFTYLFSPDNKFFIFYWLFIPMLIWFISDKNKSVKKENNKKVVNKEKHPEEKYGEAVGEFLSEGKGSAVQGHPAEAVAWLANTLGEYDIPLLKNEIILSGSLVPLEPALPGDKFFMELKGVGTCEVDFI